MTYNNIRFKVGLFVLFLILNLSGVVYYILDKKGTFDKRYNYSFTTFSADSFTVGMPVKVSGFAVGRVDEIKLLDNGNVKFIFSVDKQNQKWVCEESLLMIRKPLLGSPHIILYSAIGNPILKDGSTLDVIINNDINDLVLSLEPIVKKIGNIVNSVDKITTYLAKDNSELMKIIKNIEEFTTSLAKDKSLLTSLTGDEKATEAFIQTINKLPRLINNFNKMSSDLNKDVVPQVSELIKELNNIAKDIESKLKSLDGVVNSVGSSDKDINTIKKQIKTGLSKTNQIIEKVDNLFQTGQNEKVVLP
ncbi:MlaD family protein [Arcobacter sp. LA11]|uniref:MlaD family protein n=1 Tax=Arcobacter sp. LA11 TaxID=1898176 RepID=UPI0009348211|nr:MlaD family protein [Arcobacter sp. LA11]